MSLFITDAMAAAPASASSHSSALGSILMLVGFVVIFYFLIWRPQSKRSKDHKNLLAKLSKGDEVVTSGGMLGKVTQVEEPYVLMTISEGVEIKVQKSAVATILPKGTLKSAQ